jgi:hypothetical protein
MEPADTAWTLAEGSDLVAQLHMVPAATPQTVRPQVGLFFSHDAADAGADRGQAGVEGDRHPGRRRQLRGGGQLHLPSTSRP